MTTAIQLDSKVMQLQNDIKQANALNKTFCDELVALAARLDELNARFDAQQTRQQDAMAGEFNTRIMALEARMLTLGETTIGNQISARLTQYLTSDEFNKAVDRQISARLMRLELSSRLKTLTDDIADHGKTIDRLDRSVLSLWAFVGTEDQWNAVGKQCTPPAPSFKVMDFVNEAVKQSTNYNIRVGTIEKSFAEIQADIGLLKTDQRSLHNMMAARSAQKTAAAPGSTSTAAPSGSTSTTDVVD